MSKEFLIYCDESAQKGRHFSNFYGGLLVGSDHIEMVTGELAKKKKYLNLHGEIKWNKITENYKEKYMEMINLIFDFLKKDMIKIRIMFTQNIYIPVGLSDQHIEDEYFILYYQFIKHAFGLHVSERKYPTTRIKLFLDQLPDTKEKSTKFKSYLSALSKYPQFRAAGISINIEDIADVCSHEHDLLQCLDIILGSMNFRLNDLHLEKPVGSRIRGKRTRAKEDVYKHINMKIREIYPNFNIGTSTGEHGNPSNRWHQPYRHWLFKPTRHEVRTGHSKREES